MPTLDQIRACFSGDRYATETTGILIQDAQPGASVCTLPLRPELLNANHAPMGGAIFTLADFAFAVAVNGHRSQCPSTPPSRSSPRLRGRPSPQRRHA